MYKRLLSMALLLSLFCSCFLARADEALARAPLTAGSMQSGMVRVRLAELEGLSTLNLTIQGSYSVNGQAGRTLQSGASVTVGFNAATGQWTLTTSQRERKLSRSVSASYRSECGLPEVG